MSEREHVSASLMELRRTSWALFCGNWHRTYEVNDLLVEAGAKLSGSMLERRLVDELVVYQAPVILGAGAADMMETAAITDMNNRYELEPVDFRRFDEDWRFVFKPRY